MQTLLALIRAALAFFAGKSAGKAAQAETETESFDAAAVRISRAESAAPVDRGALVDRLRNGPGL